MSDNPDNLVLELLRAMRNEAAAFREETRGNFADMRQRLTAVELSVISLRKEVVALAETDAHIQASLDRLSDRVERIERRLEIIPA